MTNIKEVSFTETGTIRATIDGVVSFIPDDMGNRHRRAIVEWEAKGNTILPYVAPPAQLGDLTPRQLRLGLLSIGITEAQIDAALADNPAGMVEWKYSLTLKRDHPLIDSLGAAFGLPPAQIDSLWVWAADL